MKIYINNKEIKDEYNSLTLPEILDKIKNDLDNEILQEIQINEVEVNEKYLKDSLVEKEDIDEIHFITQKTEDLIKNTLNQAADYLPKLKDGIVDTAALFRNGEEEKANNKYQQIIDGIDWYTDVLSKISKIIGDENLYNESQELIKGFNKPLTELMVAYNKNDIVLVADILEYEIVDYIDDFIEFNEKLNQLKFELSDNE